MKGQNKVKISFICKKGAIFFGDEIKLLKKKRDF